MYAYRKRRDFLKLSGLAVLSLFIPISLSADKKSGDTIPTLKNTISNGDPFNIKTSLNEINFNQDIAIKYELSLDDTFNTITYQGEHITNQEKDFNIKIDTDNLNSNTKYYYRLSVYNEENSYWVNKMGKIRFI